jgi:hypothetical protein
MANHEAQIERDESWDTWTVQRSYYGMHDIAPGGQCTTHPVAWVVEFATEAEAERIVRNAAAIDALLAGQHVRISVRFDRYGTAVVMDYDRGCSIGTFAATA